jgi:UDP-N-acetylglucosamine:LPS N-acetylglucosamine transferase
MKTKTILLVYGEGGHKAQMMRLYKKLQQEDVSKKIEFIGICENMQCIDTLKINYSFPPLRDKFSILKTLYMLPVSIIKYIYVLAKIHLKHNPVAIISTGPGIAIIASIYFKIFRKKIIFVETWSRFSTTSLTGRVMYRLANKFYIQNKSLDVIFPKAIYSGLL